jgi:FKBP-type peptidyl-prolyl cis-trans isomerase
VGERRLITVPSELAYGDHADFSTGKQVPPRSDLVYDIELVELESKLTVAILQEGAGTPIEAGQQGEFHYLGVLAKDGTVFDSSPVGQAQPLPPLSPGSLIEGWVLALPGMKPGEKRRLRIPSALAYGETGSGELIGPNEDLVFDVELAAVIPAPTGQ